VFGDRSIDASHARYRSTGSIGRESDPITVHETARDETNTC
jgi:hypothetical protein